MPADPRRAVRLAVIGGLSSFGPLSLDLYLRALPHVATALHTSDGAGVVLLAGVVLFLPESLPAGYRQNANDSQGLLTTGRLARALVAGRLFVRAVSALVLASAMLFIYLSLSSDILQRDYGLSTNAFSAMFAVNSVGDITAGLVTTRLLRRHPPQRLLAVGLGAGLTGATGLCAAVAAGAPTPAVLPFLFVCVTTMGTIIPTATNLAMLNHPEAAGAGSAILGGAQYAVGGLAGPPVTLAGDSAPAMSIGMAIAAAGAVAAAWLGRGRSLAAPDPYQSRRKGIAGGR